MEKVIEMIYKSLIELKNDMNPDQFCRQEIAKWTQQHIMQTGNKIGRVLDIGLGDAQDLLLIRDSTQEARIEIYGIEFNKSRIRKAREKGIEVFPINIEKEPIPLSDDSLDVLIANHVIEHLKELFFFFSEVSRVLKPGGIGIIGCPNLGGWHNRLALLFGHQPPCMKLLGSHIRGITIPSFKEFIEFGGFFKIQKIKGRAFYFAPGFLSQSLASLLPGLAAATHFVILRTNKPGKFIEVLDMDIPGITDTPYFRG